VLSLHERHQAMRLAQLLEETGRHHHQEFIESDGADPEWPLWYAEHLFGRIDEFVDGELTRSKIVQCLMNAAEAHAANRPDEPWHLFYADYLLGLRQTDMTTKHSPA
jgi:NAD(P)H-hydrate epimerase